MANRSRGSKVIPGPTLGAPPWPRFLRFARTLTLASGVAPALGGWSCSDTGQKSSTDAFVSDTHPADAEMSFDAVVSGVRPLPADARTSTDQAADATLVKDASSSDGFFSGIRIMPDAESPDAPEASHPADAAVSPYDGGHLGIAPYDGGRVGIVGRPYDGGPVGSAPAPDDAAASKDAMTDVRGTYDGRILGVVARPPDAGVVAIDAAVGNRTGVGGPHPAPELPGGWWGTPEV